VIAVRSTAAKRQDEDRRPQLDDNFDAIRALLFTTESIDAGFGIWDAGTSLSSTNITGSHVLRKIYGVPGFDHVFCILTCLQRVLTRMIIRVVVLESVNV